MSTARILLCAGMALCTPLAQGQSAAGVSFVHYDWQLACDNTRTCRAAGYQPEGEERAVSVLLTRIAGPDQPVTGEVMLGNYNESDVVAGLPAEFEFSLRIDGEAAGSVTMDKDSLLAKMSAQQVAALLDALTRDSTIEWSARGEIWLLSDSGSTAVLLKMDEFQGRLDTPGALVRKGNRPEHDVLPPLPVPVMASPAPVGARAGDDALAATHSASLLAALRATLEDPYDCMPLTEARAGEPILQINRLTADRILVSMTCAEGTYNDVTGFWLVSDTEPFTADLVTVAGTEYQDGSIYASSKQRGLGDCWSLERWTFDGRQFVHSSSSTTGLCREIAPGGAWSMPTLTMDIEAQEPVLIADGRLAAAAPGGKGPARPVPDVSQWESSAPVLQAVATARRYWAAHQPDFQEELRILGSARGAFTRPDVEQHAVLFRMSNYPRGFPPTGLAIVEDNRLVRNIAFATIAQSVSGLKDIDGDGRDELVFADRFIGQGMVTEGVWLAALDAPGLRRFGNAIIFESACGAGYGDGESFAAKLTFAGSEIRVERYRLPSCESDSWQLVGEPGPLEPISDGDVTEYIEAPVSAGGSD